MRLIQGTPDLAHPPRRRVLSIQPPGRGGVLWSSKWQLVECNPHGRGGSTLRGEFDTEAQAKDALGVLASVDTHRRPIAAVSAPRVALRAN